MKNLPPAVAKTVHWLQCLLIIEFGILAIVLNASGKTIIGSIAIGFMFGSFMRDHCNKKKKKD